MSRKIPVVEIFGPTIQGEGPEQGRPCYFVRLGGCDFKCTWCDSPFAVLPELVRHAERMDSDQIIGRLDELNKMPIQFRNRDTIVLSGGNPLLHDLTDLVNSAHELNMRVTVETQGTLWKQWLLSVDQVVVSPKPPSSTMRQSKSDLCSFMKPLLPNNTCLKVVVFDHADYEYAVETHLQFPEYMMYLSAGNDAGATVGEPDRKDERSLDQVRGDLCNQGRWLANRVMIDARMSDAQIQMQQHVLYWGNERGR